MTKEEIIEELEQMRDNGCGVVEMWEFVEENTDLDPTIFADYLL